MSSCLYYACIPKLGNKTCKEAACSRHHSQVETNLNIAAGDAVARAGGTLTSSMVANYWMGLRMTDWNVAMSSW